MKHYRVLLIDSSEDFRHNIAELLQGEGFTVTHACDAYSGLQNINLQRPHVVICDTVIGDSSAIELIEALKETGNSTIEKTPFIFLYSALDEKTMMQARAYGVEHFIDKLRPWPDAQKAVWEAITPSIH